MSRNKYKGAHFAQKGAKPRGLFFDKRKDNTDGATPAAEATVTQEDAATGDAATELPTDAVDAAVEAQTIDTAAVVPVDDTLVGSAIDVDITVEKPAIKVDLTEKVPTIDSDTAAEEPAATDEPSPATGEPEPLSVLTSEAAVKTFVEPKKSSIGLILGILFVLALGGAYAGGVWASKHYFMPDTHINGEDVSLQSVEDVATQHSKATDGYKLEIKGQGLDITVTASDVDLRSDGNAYVRDALSQVDPWTWPLELLNSPHQLTADESITYDQKKLETFVTSAVEAFNKKATMPKDASFAYDEATHLYKVTPEEPGTAVDTKQVVAQAVAAFDKLEPSTELGEELVIKPTITSDDKKLNERVNAVNKQLSATQKLTVGDNDVFEVGSDLIAKWVTVDKELKVTIDQEAITKWARGELSDKLDTVGTNRSYTRPDGKSISVSGGTYGWTIDGGELAKVIYDNIQSGTTGTIDIPMMQTAETWNPGGQDWGKRYIDIDISEQHVRMYDGSGSLIWESDCVTGNTSEGHDTPLGVYTINNNKESGSVRLEGPDDERTGEPEYVSYVTYWMPFVWNAVALHDATWRYSFGGSIYQTDGSHGCVNLPYDKAEELYGITQVGDVVITHY